MIKRVIFYLCISLLFCACSQKEILDKDAKLKAQSLMYAQKIKLKKADSNGILVVFYLNPVLKESNNKEIFIVSIAPKEFQVPHFEFFINDKRGVVEKLEDNNEYLKYIITNRYATYFKFSNDIQKTNVIIAKVCFEQKCVELDFQKYSKSLHYRSIDVDKQYN